MEFEKPKIQRVHIQIQDRSAGGKSQTFTVYQTTVDQLAREFRRFLASRQRKSRRKAAKEKPELAGVG